MKNRLNKITVCDSINTIFCSLVHVPRSSGGEDCAALSLGDPRVGPFLETLQHVAKLAHSQAERKWLSALHAAMFSRLQLKIYTIGYRVYAFVGAVAGVYRPF